MANIATTANVPTTADILTGRRPGYLASIDNVPPLIFRFQLNPDILSEKLSYKYNEANSFGAWKFDTAKSIAGGVAAGVVAAALPTAGIFDAMDNVKNFSAALVNVRPLRPDIGEARTFAIDFSLDARLADLLDEGDHYGGSIEPDLFILRSFMYPSMDMVQFGKWIASGFADKERKANPPLCSLFYAGLSVTCVMTDLNIKIVSFADDGRPQRADVSVSLKEQTFSMSPIVEFLQRNVQVLRSFGRKNIGQDIKSVTPILNLFT